MSVLLPWTQFPLSSGTVHEKTAFCMWQHGFDSALQSSSFSVGVWEYTMVSIVDSNTAAGVAFAVLFSPPLTHVSPTCA